MDEPKEKLEKKWRVQILESELMELNDRNRKTWRESKAYVLIAFCSYLTSGTAPEHITTDGKFWPGLTSMALLLIAGVALYWIGRHKVGNDGGTTTLRLSD